MKKLKKVFLCLLAVLAVAGAAPGLLAGAGAASVQAASEVPSPKMVSVKNSGTKKAIVTWKKAAGADGYRIYRKSLGGSWQKLSVIKESTAVSFTDTEVIPGECYVYSVRAYKKADGKTSWSTFNKTGMTVLIPLPSPELVKAADTGRSSIKVYWQTVSRASGYEVYRKTAGSSWKKLATVESDGNSRQYYTDSAVKIGTSYTYTVRAYRKTSEYKVKGYYNRNGLTVKAQREKPNIVVSLYRAENPTYVCALTIKNKGTKALTIPGYAALGTPANNTQGQNTYDMWTLSSDGTAWAKNSVIPAGKTRTLILARMDSKKFYIKTTSYIAFQFNYNGRDYIVTADYYGNDLTLEDITNKRSSALSDLAGKEAALNPITDRSLLADSIHRLESGLE